MAHTLIGPSGRPYFHNGDYSGGFDFYLSANPEDAEKMKAKVSNEDVLALAAALVRSRLVEITENAPDEDIVRWVLGASQPQG